MAEVVKDVSVEPLADNEVVVRLESHGVMRSYAINYDVMGGKWREVYPLMIEMLPRILRPIIEGAMFAIRHGPIQKLAKKQGIDPDLYLKRPGVNHDAAAAELLAVLSFRQVRAEQVAADGSFQNPVDIMQQDIVDAYEGVFRRVESYDRIPHTEPEPALIEPPEGALG